jgi:hypothetical protein
MTAPGGTAFEINDNASFLTVVAKHPKASVVREAFR